MFRLLLAAVLVALVFQTGQCENENADSYSHLQEEAKENAAVIDQLNGNEMEDKDLSTRSEPGIIAEKEEIRDISTDGQLENNEPINDDTRSVPQRLSGTTSEQVETVKRASTECGQSDVVFILDASGSVGKSDFKKMLNFVKSFISGVKIGPNAVLVSIISYGTKARIEFFLNSHNTASSLWTAVSQVQKLGGSTNTSLALSYARKYSFSSRYGSRYAAAKLAVVITDGKSNDATKTASEAYKLRRLGVTVFAVGVGKGPDKKELRAIATNPDWRHVFVAANYNALKNIKKQLQKKACSPVCRSAYADIAFVLDTSGSVGNSNFQKVLLFAQNTVKNFEVGKGNGCAQFGALTFGTYVYPQFYFNTYSSKTEILRAIRNIRYTGGGTNTGAALKTIREKFFIVQRGSRSLAKKVVVVVTDGKSNSPSETSRQAKILHGLGAQVFAIGIGPNVSEDELNAIASDPDDKHVIIIKGYGKSLMNIKSKIIKEIF